jgi:DNA-binding NarL/FixJ family response regulator
MKLSELTPRRRQIVELVSEGLSNKEIAAKLGIAPDTVDRILCTMYDKFLPSQGTRNRLALTRLFFEFRPIA